MVSVARHIDRDLSEESPSSVVWLTPAEGKRMLDDAVRERLGISGGEFIRRWDAGEYAEIADQPGHLHIGYLGSLIPFARDDV